jgi:thiol-disulfide isomerase/thioredoxin
MTRWLAILVIVFVAIVALASCGSKESDSKQAQGTTPQTGGGDAPAEVSPAGAGIQFAALDLYGQSQSSEQWIGKRPVVLNFWGTWCPPCRREIPDLVKLYDEYRPRGIALIGLAVKDEPADVNFYAMRAGMKWVMLMASNEALQSYDVVNGIPTTIFIGADGREITRFIGNRSYEDFKPAFEAILQGYRP